MKYVYTDAATQELEAFQTRQQRLLEDLVAERKFVYGDDTVEVTASDIRSASNYIRPFRPQAARYTQLRTLAQGYVAIGAVITIGGVFYPSLEAMIHENRVQALTILMGVLMMVIGFVAGIVSRTRLRRRLDAETFFHDLKNRKIP